MSPLKLTLRENRTWDFEDEHAPKNSFKILNDTDELIEKQRQKIVMKNFYETKNWSKYLRRPKQKLKYL